jgi:hypothetical protein
VKIAFFILLGLVALIGVAWVIGYLFYRARMQHYVFAHQALPLELFAEPELMLAPLIDATGFSEAGRQHLLRFWEASAEGCEARDLVSADELTYSMEVLGHPNSTAIFILLPPPKVKPEAYFALMVFDAPGLATSKIRHLRYFTLEYHGQKNGVPKTLMGEWKDNGKGGLDYESYDRTTPPDKAAFLARVEQIIQESGSQPAPAGGAA